MNALYVLYWNTLRPPAQFTLIANAHPVTFALLVKRKLSRVKTHKIVCVHPVPMKLSNQRLVRMNVLHVGNVPTMNFKRKYATEQ